MLIGCGPDVAGSGGVLLLVIGSGGRVIGSGFTGRTVPVDREVAEGIVKAVQVRSGSNGRHPNGVCVS